MSESTSNLYAQLLHYPQEIIPLMDLIVNDIFSELFPEVNTAESPIQIRPFNIGKTVNVRLLDPSGIINSLYLLDIDQLVAIKGIVVRVSNIVPDMRLGI